MPPPSLDVFSRSRQPDIERVVADTMRIAPPLFTELFCEQVTPASVAVAREKQNRHPPSLPLLFSAKLQYVIVTVQFD